MKYAFLFLAAGLFSLAIDAQAAPVPTADVYRIAAPEVKRIFGNERQDAFVSNGLLREAILESIGEPDDPQALRDGSTMMSGCRPQSCMEKGAVIVDAVTRKLSAAALLHFHCRLGSSGNTCDPDATLEVFIIRRDGLAAGAVREQLDTDALVAWGERAGFKTKQVHVKAVRN